jgi:hypothetical protein
MILARSGILPPQAWALLLALAVSIGAMLVLSSLPLSAYRPRPRRGSRRRWRPQTQTVRPQRRTIAWPAPVPTRGRRPGQVTPEYRDYILGRIPGKDGIFWPERIRPWKAEFRARRARCEIGTVLRALGHPNCGPRPVAGPIHADHTDRGYRNLFCETREDVALGCESCHDTREALKRQGVYIYAELEGSR